MKLPTRRKEDTSKKRLFKLPTFIMVLYPGWQLYRDITDPISFFNNKKGIIQVLTFTRDKEIELGATKPEEVLKKYIEKETKSEVKMKRFEKNDSTYVLSDYYKTKDKTMRAMFIENKKKAAFVTFAHETIPKDDEDIEKMLISFELGN
ncbi:MAG: hypothetical protein ABIJ92_00825 [Candidatus Aenigmatarchaeota archaeon]